MPVDGIIPFRQRKAIQNICEQTFDPSQDLISIMANSPKRAQRRLAANFFLYWIDNDYLSPRQREVLASMLAEGANDDGEVLE